MRPLSRFLIGFESLKLLNGVRARDAFTARRSE